MGYLREECVRFIRKRPPTVDRILQAHAFGMVGHLTFCIDTLIRAGQEDWGKCVDDLDLLKIIHRRYVAERKRTRVELDQCLPQGYVHKKGRLDCRHKLNCGKCEKASKIGR